MKQYTVSELKNPQTYIDDPELERFARSFAGSIRQIIADEYGYGVEVDGVEIVLSGAYAERVHKSWEKRRAKMHVEQEQYAQDFNLATEILEKLVLPQGVSIGIDGHNIRLGIPRDGGIMTPRVKRLGGWWDNDEKMFVLPLSAAKSLPRVIKNWERAYAKKTADIVEKRRAQERERREREEQWERERQEREAQRVQERQERERRAARARANRTRVIVGKYQIGDSVPWGDETRIIKSFGQSWTKTEMRVPDKYWHGTLYQECAVWGCRNEPVELDTEMCERHHPHAVEITTEYCYAYFVD